MSYPKQKYFPSEPIPLPGSTSASQMDIWKAIDFNNHARVEEIIKGDKDKLSEKGWNEMLPLHMACLRSQFEIVQLLVKHGADINGITSFEETPMHYACRAGDLPIVHWLCENGANMNSKDKRGRVCMHFAAMGSSITVMHYLATQLGHKYDVNDSTGQNALHICSEKNNITLYDYLLRKNRVDPSLSDLKGITPMHIVAEKGYGEMAWMLLKVGNCGLLQLKNHAGETPVKLAFSGKTESHRRLAKELEYQSKRSPPSPPRGPIVAYYFALFCAFVSMGMIFVLTHYLNGYGGYFAFVLFALMVGYITKQSHRILHISRWPNPVFKGFFTAGIVHCTFAQYYKMYPAIWPCHWHALISTTFVFLCYYHLYNLTTKSIGVKKYPRLDPITGSEMTVLDIATKKCREYDFCPYAECIKHEKSKYCRICELTIVNMDHHCLFVNNCISSKNHREFIVFLMIVMVLQCLFMQSFWTFIYYDPSFATMLEKVLVFDIIRSLFHNQPWLFTLSVMSLFSLMWEGALVFQQLVAISYGETIYSSMHMHNHRSHRLTRMDMLGNLIRFFMKTKKDSRSVSKSPLIYA